ncbi:signal peptidase I [Bacillus sp. HMF5848]|uniref:signal peptidase I n=1 Tax=Bacillus sp. HMF5848 TaxID=2495421 RepID=UPI000F767056|nr:signal peptidase I [Bacillus sp. HMF5848]RSK27500.1 signal peptidase I [Bacillus sp. HMF5848]
MRNTSFIKETLGWVKALLIGFTLAIVISAFVVQPYVVNGSSMEPTLEGTDPTNTDKQGDLVLVYKSAYVISDMPDYNDIVVVDKRINRKRTIKDSFLESPIINKIVNGTNNQDLWVKRVIGKSGDKLEYIDGKVYRNGEELDEAYIKEDMEISFTSVTVPDGHVFVMGDNRNRSLDSRVIGPVPLDNLVGKILVRFYPLNKVSPMNN